MIRFDRPDFQKPTKETAALIKRLAEDMDVQQWHHYLYGDGTLIRTLLLNYNNYARQGFSWTRFTLSKRIAGPGVTYNTDIRGNWSIDLLPDDIPKIPGRTVKRILVIEDDFMFGERPATVQQEIRRRVEQLKTAGLRFDGIIFVETDVLQHWRHRFSGGISALYRMRKDINRI